MEKRNAKFIVIEGLDGSGKTIQTNSLAKRIIDEGYPLHQTRECSDGPIGKLLRDVYLPGHRIVDERMINVLFAADRMDHISNKDDGVITYLETGTNVISDRYVYSSYAYYAYREYGNDKRFQDAMDFIFEINRTNCELLLPDITIYLNVPPEECVRRLSERTEVETTVFENINKLSAIDHAYLTGIQRMRDLYNDNIVEVDGVGSEEEVTERLWKKVQPLLAN